MSFRPVPANWFEAVTTRNQLAQVIACLARTGAVELESQDGDSHQPAVPNLDAALKEWVGLSHRNSTYWPPAHLPELHEEPALELERALGMLRAWQSEADPLINRLEQLSAESKALLGLGEAISAIGSKLPPLSLLANAGPRLCVCLVMFPDQTPRELPLLLSKTVHAANAVYVLMVGRPSDVREVEAVAAGLKGVMIALPKWLPDTAKTGLEEISRKQAALASERAELDAKLAGLSKRHGVAEALGTINLMEWLSQQARSLNAGERLVVVTGWTADGDGTALAAALRAAGLSALVHIGEAPPGHQVPILMKNPYWVKDFEAFVRLLGTPAPSEADPSQLLAFIAPVLFGFMFGDVGQGLVLAVAGLFLQHHTPFLRMLIPGGLAAALFGALYGSVFAREDIIPALWVHPISHPVLFLKIALGAGAVILSLGLLLDAVQAYWRGEAPHWWRNRGGLAAAYAGLLASPLSASSLWLCAAGAFWFVLGAVFEAPAGRRLGAILTGAFEFLEQGMQLVMNTISFTRVGAFALAHAGLSTAVVAISASAGSVGSLIVLVLGNVLIIALEGLVVAIQTTRLILFEFFIRFLKGGGRAFKPLAPPSITGWGSSESLWRF
ncbi:MAG: V-type ATP synthase subunit I [Rhodomicrobium sp.]